MVEGYRLGFLAHHHIHRSGQAGWGSLTRTWDSRTIASDTKKPSGVTGMKTSAGIVAAAIDTQSSLQLTFIWTFNNHGIFHLIQMLSLLLLTIRVYSTHKSTLYETVLVE